MYQPIIIEYLPSDSALCLRSQARDLDSLTDEDPLSPLFFSLVCDIVKIENISLAVFNDADSL